MLRHILCFSFVTVILPHLSHGAVKADYYALYDSLFATNTYKKEVRPAESENSTLQIYMVFNLLALVDVDEKQQTLKTSARLKMSWDDDYLSWSSSSFAGIKSLLVPQKNLYLPDIIVGNSVTEQKKLGYDEYQVRLLDSGDIEWEPTVLLSTSCDIVITYFPFDTQKCYIQFETAVSRKEEIDVNIDKDETPISLEDYSENGQWEVIKVHAENLGDEGSTTRMRFGLLLKRRRTFYILNIILPVFFLSLCSSLVFALPADEGEKMGTGITVLLAFAVYLTILSDLVPNTSLQVSILGLYLTILLGMSAVSIIVCVFILRLHFRDADRPVGYKTAAITHFLRRIMCLESSKNQVKPSESEQSDRHDKSEPKMNGKRSPSITVSMETNADLTWQDVAHTLDLLCFIFFSILTIVITIVCMVTLDVGGATNKPTL